VKNFAKKTFLSFNTIAVLLHDVMVPENGVREAGQCSWFIFVGNFELRL